MKTQLTVLAILLSVLITGNLFAQGVGINNPTPASSAMLDVVSTTKGMLVPRMTSAQRTAIAAPATGLLVYDSTLNQFYYFNGTIWTPISAAAGWGVTGNTGTSATTNFIGTTDAQDVVFKSNNAEQMRIASNGKIGLGVNNPANKLEIRSGGLGISSSAKRYELMYDSVGTNFYIDEFGTGRHFVIKDGGNVGIGSLNPTARLEVGGQIKITGGGIGAGKVLTSDAAGLATWQTPTSDWGLSGNGGTNSATNFIGTTDVQDVVFKSNNAERMRIASGGNIGLGVINPSSKFEIRNGGLGISSASKKYELNYDQAGAYFYIDEFGAGRHFTIKDGGNVGIGTSTPTSKLEVNGQIKITGGTPGAGKVLTSDAAGLATWQTPSASSNDWGLSGNTGTNAATNFIGTTDNNPVVFRTNNVERIRMDNNGKLLIGTTVGMPSNKLEIVGGNVNVDNLSAYTIKNSSGSPVKGIYMSGNILRVSEGFGLTSELNLVYPSALMSSITMGDGLGVNQVYFRNDGKTGFGVPNPIAQLELSGQIKINGGTPGNGKVLTSDASGLASWQPTSNWSLTGNAGTNTSFNYIGTSDNNDVLFRRGGIESLRLTIGGALLARGDMLTGVTPTTGAGQRMMWIPAKSAFRAGQANSSQWDDVNIGPASFAAGNSNIAFGMGSAAFGTSNDAHGMNAFAAGGTSVASGDNSVAIGNTLTASGYASATFGDHNFATGNFSVAIGSNNTAAGANAVVLGLNNNTTMGTNAVAIGTNNLSSAQNSIALGTSGNASANYSFTAGQNCIARSVSETVVGQFNDPILSSPSNTWSGTNPLFIIGNGTSTAATSNAVVVQQNGNVGLGVNNPAAKLDINGSIKVGQNGSVINKIQTGEYVTPGPGIAGVNTFIINFPYSFMMTPKINVTVKNANNTDMFAVTIKSVTSGQAIVNVYRIDLPGNGWGAPISIDWMAWE